MENFKRTSVEFDETLEGCGLTLSAEENERGCADVLVEDRNGNSSSYDCAVGEGQLDSIDGESGRVLSYNQQAWLEKSPEVTKYLDRIGY